MAATYLDKILDHHRAVAAADSRLVEALLDEARRNAADAGLSGCAGRP